MTSDLFPDCRQDSPRLAWMKRHGITIRPITDFERSLFSEFSRDLILNFAALKKRHDKYLQTGVGETEDNALADLAEQLGIPLWNEEQYAKEHK